MKRKPIVKARITFLSENEGGRQSMLVDAGVGYKPHLVIQDPTIRKAAVDNKNQPTENYLGVNFIGGPSLTIKSGEENEFELECFYYPEVNYEKLVKGAMFTVREGARIVGFGEII